MLLNISKKAATEAQAERILEQSYAFCADHDPYGVPVLVLRPEEFDVQGTIDDLGNVQSKYHDLLSRFLKRIGKAGGKGQQLLRQSSDGRTVLEITHTLIAANLSENYMHASCTAIHNAPFLQNADQYAAGSYNAPAFAIIQAPRQDMDVAKRLSYILGTDNINLAPDLPGMAAQWQFLDLWHEIGHASGAGEPQTEKMAAVMCRKAFNDVSFLQAEADIRYAKSILFFEDSEICRRYGWGMGQAVDEVLAMEGAEIDALGDEEIRDMRFDPYDPLMSTVKAVGTRIRQEVGQDKFDGNHLGDIAETLKGMLSRNVFKDAAQPEKSVAARFYVAVSRLSQGGKAYRRTNLSF